MRRTLVLAVLLCACGARSEINGTGVSFDASISVIDGSNTNDGGTNDAIVDGHAGQDSASCTAAVVQIGCANKACENCKFGVEWTCGDV
jgi:hypothetical protein